MADLAALIVTLGTDISRVQRTVAAVLASRTELSREVIVVVNANADPFTRGLFPDSVRVILAGANLGWAGGLQLGRAVTRSRMLWLVQDDMEPDPLCLEALWVALRTGERPAVVGPVIVENAERDTGGVIIDGTVAKHAFGGILNPAVFDRVGTEFDDSEPIIVGRTPAHDTVLRDLERPAAGDYIPSRGMMMLSSTWDAVGGADASFYPVGATDVDFCRALHAAGMTFDLVPGARATHLGSASTPRSLARAVFGRNRRRVVDKWRDGNRLTPALHPDVSPAVRDAVLTGATEAVAAMSLELERVTAQRDALRERIAVLQRAAKE